MRYRTNQHISCVTTKFVNFTLVEGDVITVIMIDNNIVHAKFENHNLILSVKDLDKLSQIPERIYYDAD